MLTGSLVRIKSDHQFHANRQGIILFFGEETSSGLVVLSDPEDSKIVFAVNINDIVCDSYEEQKF